MLGAKAVILRMPWTNALLISYIGGEQINLPAIMISHMSRIANIAREHDLGYGLLLTSIFKHFKVSLQMKVGLQVSNDIGKRALLGCGF